MSEDKKFSISAIPIEKFSKQPIGPCMSCGADWSDEWVGEVMCLCCPECTHPYIPEVP